MSAPDPRIARLPDVARELAEELGYDMGLKLMIEFGGMQMNIPVRPLPKRSPIWKVLGEDAAKALSRRFGGNQVEIPIGNALRAAERNRAIAKHKGSHNQAARAFGCTRRWVRMARKAARAPLPLFEGLSKQP